MSNMNEHEERVELSKAEREERVELLKVAATFAFLVTAVFALGSPILIALAPKLSHGFRIGMIIGTTVIGVLIAFHTLIYIGFFIWRNRRQTSNSDN